MTMINDSVFDIEAYIAKEFARRIAAKEEEAFFIGDGSGKPVAVIEAVCAFMVFNNLKIKNSSIINTLASETFGVLLIHANSDTMRSWLWGDVLNVVGVHSQGNGYLHIVLSVLGVYFVCTAIDLVRIYVIEKLVFKRLDIALPGFECRFRNTVDSVCKKLNIG